MTARWLLPWLLVTPLFGQFTFYGVEGDQEKPLGVQYSLGSTAVGDPLVLRVRLKNTGNAAATTSLVSVAGQGFVIRDLPSLPQTVSAGKSIEFNVWFQVGDAGSYSANLKADHLSVILQATAAPSVTVYLVDGVSRRALSAASPVDFGNIQRGSSSSLSFSVENTTRQSLVIAAAVNGEGFHMSVAMPASVLAPGDSLGFSITCQPAGTGALAGTLQVGQRRFPLKANGTDPPLPRPEILVDLPNASSGQQGKITIRLNSASESSGSGKLSVDFRPAVTGAGDDPAVLFPLTGNRSAQASVLAGDLAARFGSQTSLEFQTGTTAGTLVFTLQFGGYTVQATATMPPAAIHLESASGARTASGLELRATGFDNTRSAGTLRFTFYDRAGKMIQPGAIEVDSATDFRRYFDSANAGGMFALRAVFPVTGPADQIAGAEIEMVNSAGSARSERISF